MNGLCSLMFLLILSSASVQCVLNVQSGTFVRTYSAENNRNRKSIFKSPNLLRCLLQCLNLGEECRSWEILNDKDECNLQLDKDDERNGTVLEKYERIITCKSSLCLNGGTCKDIMPTAPSPSAYSCQCRCGTCGKNCQYLNFIRKPRTAIAGRNLEEEKNMSSEQCMQLCLNNSDCKSIDYNRKEMICYLNKGTHESESTEVFMDVDYYYPNCTCPQN